MLSVGERDASVVRTEPKSSAIITAPGEKCGPGNRTLSAHRRASSRTAPPPTVPGQPRRAATPATRSSRSPAVPCPGGASTAARRVARFPKFAHHCRLHPWSSRPHGTTDDGSVATGGDWSMRGRCGWAGGGAAQAARPGERRRTGFWGARPYALGRLGIACVTDCVPVIGVRGYGGGRGGRRLLAALDLPYPKAGDPPADSATICGVETLPTAFVLDGAGFVRHVQRGAAARNINPIESSISALIEPMRRPEEGQP